MEAPKTLNDYFVSVDNFFRKTFRDDAVLSFAVKTHQHSESIWGQNVFSGLSEAQAQEALGGTAVTTTIATTTGEVPALHHKTGAGTPNSVSLSPRVVLNRDGTSLGKVKLSSLVDFPHVCKTNFGFAVDTAGVCRGFGKLNGLIEGFVVSGRVGVNTLAPASEDVTLLSAQYQYSDFYSGLTGQRNGLGSSNILFDCGARFFNILIGGGFERQRLSYLEHRDGQEIFDVVYAGVGITETNWSFAAKLTRTPEAWQQARLSFLQRCTPSTAVACSYDFDIIAARAHVSLGFTQGFRLRLPAFFQCQYGATAAQDSGRGVGLNSSTESGREWTTVTPLVLACKAESDGHCAATLRGYFNRCLRWGVVVHRNMLVQSSPLKFGLILTMEVEN